MYNIFCDSISKGQLISKRLFGAFNFFQKTNENKSTFSAVFSGGAGGASSPPEFRGSQKGRSLISAYQSLAITTNTPGFEKLNTALTLNKYHSM